MNVIKTEFPDLQIVEPFVIADSRGYFFESYQQERYINNGILSHFIQDNESLSGYGVVRGLHYQLEPYAQAKLIRVISGKVLDVAVDLRKGSPTFGKWFGVELSGENKRQLYIPRGFAHGFSALSEKVVFSYKCDNYYSKDSERAIKFNDPNLNIDWKVPVDKMIVSEKDSQASEFNNAEMNFTFKG